MRATALPALGAFLLLSWPTSADPPANPYEPQVKKGRAYLFGSLKNERRLGHLALGALALQKTAPATEPIEPELRRLIDRVGEAVDRNAPEFQSGGEWNYVAAVSLLCLVADDVNVHEQRVRKLVRLLVERQADVGAWGYQGGGPDTSQTQYALLALWEASKTGIDVPKRVWDRALHFHVLTQDNDGPNGDGGFAYHPDMPRDGKPKNQGTDTATMSVAGLGSMLICRERLQLAKVAGGRTKASEFVRVALEAEQNEEPRRSEPFAVQRAIERAAAWVERNSGMARQSRVFAGARLNYYLYGLERAAALARPAEFRKTDWYVTGATSLVYNQLPDGSWPGEYAGVPDTAFALMFLDRVTSKPPRAPKFERLGKSQLRAFRGVPAAGDFADQDGDWRRQQERFRDRPRADVEDLAKAFDDPAAFDTPEDRAASVEALSPAQLRALLAKVGADRRKLRQLAYDSRPEARAAALTLLSRTGDFKAAPILLDGLVSKDAAVYAAARDGIGLLSRNGERFGLPADSTDAAAVNAGVRRAREWFESLQIETPAYAEFTPPSP